MRKTKLALLVAASTGSALLAISPSAFALSEAERLERLEKTLQKLEQRLENSEQENRILKNELAKGKPNKREISEASEKKIKGTANNISSLGADSADKPVTHPELKELDKKVTLIQ